MATTVDSAVVRFLSFWYSLSSYNRKDNDFSRFCDAKSLCAGMSGRASGENVVNENEIAGSESFWAYAKLESVFDIFEPLFAPHCSLAGGASCPFKCLA